MIYFLNKTKQIIHSTLNRATQHTFTSLFLAQAFMLSPNLVLNLTPAVFNFLGTFSCLLLLGQHKNLLQGFSLLGLQAPGKHVVPVRVGVWQICKSGKEVVTLRNVGKTRSAKLTGHHFLEGNVLVHAGRILLVVQWRRETLQRRLVHLVARVVIVVFVLVVGIGIL